MLHPTTAAASVVVVLMIMTDLNAQPKFQYEAPGIQISIPTANEPRISRFGPESLAAAVKYLEDGALSWAHGRGCVNCHTTGPYLVERSAWSDRLGKPSTVVLESFLRDVPKSINPIAETEKDGHRYYPGAFSSVWRSLGLAEWDRHITKTTTESTARSLRDMLEHQSSSGAFVTHGEVEIPHITTDFELSLQAIRAIMAAPGWLDSLQDPLLVAKIGKLKHWLREATPKNDFDRILLLQLASIAPDLVTGDEIQSSLTLLTSKQHSDGGWCIRDMSSLEDWHFEISDTVRKLISNLPDAQQPQSDPYMTALAIVLLRQSGIPVEDLRVQNGLKWLQGEQRESGRWWMHSLYRGNFHYTTYLATVQALKAFDLCGQLTLDTATAAQ
jgi:squalene-hopene/tetraprenyl-beta-curcumene cyclase